MKATYMKSDKQDRIYTPHQEATKEAQTVLTGIIGCCVELKEQPGMFAVATIDFRFNEVGVWKDVAYGSGFYPAQTDGDHPLEIVPYPFDNVVKFIFK